MSIDHRQINHRPSEEHLLSQEQPAIEMNSSAFGHSLEQGESGSGSQPLEHEVSMTKDHPRVHQQYTDNEDTQALHRLESEVETQASEAAHIRPVYKVYKRRWFGLIQLVLLNIVVSWDVGHPVISLLNHQLS